MSVKSGELGFDELEFSDFKFFSRKRNSLSNFYARNKIKHYRSFYDILHPPYSPIKLRICSINETIHKFFS